MNKGLVKRKAKMYKRVVKEIENGNYCSKAPEIHEKLYHDARQWGKAKLPPSMEVHTDLYQSQAYI